MKTTQLQRKYMIFVGILGQIIFFTQAYKIFHHQSAEDLSLEGFIISGLAAINWLIYGMKIRDTPLIVSNALGLIGVTIVVCGIISYG